MALSTSSYIVPPGSTGGAGQLDTGFGESILRYSDQDYQQAMNLQAQKDRASDALLGEQQKGLSSQRKQREQLFEMLLGGGGGGNPLADLFGGLSQPGFPDAGGGGRLSQPGFPDASGGDFSQPGFPDAGGPAGGGSLYDLIDASGAGQRARINQDYQSAQGSALAALQNRGWAGSNLLPASFASLSRERSFQLGDLESSLLGQKVGVGERAIDRQTGIRESALDRRVQQQQILSSLFSQLLG